MNRTVVVVLGLSVLLSPVAADAGPITVDVLSASYSLNITLNSNFGDGQPSQTLTATAADTSPVNTTLHWTAPNGLTTEAIASADWLGVSGEMHGGYIFNGSATSNLDLVFSPVTDDTAILEVSTFRCCEYTSGLGTLFDVTTQQQVWKFYWGTDFGSAPTIRIPIVEGDTVRYSDYASGLDSFLLPTALSASHVYELELTQITRIYAAGNWSTIQISGLEPVPTPEPSSLALLGVGLGTTLASRRRLRARLDP
jgi:hypothetical protein